ncbi:MAG: MBL fold metallo-hydrolase [Dehalococcoidia bacterium]|nr:MBL fold metallo-hydrolase [Dehalococcoidia bacterium]
MEHVAPGIYRVETPLAGTAMLFAAYIIKESGVLIEPGPAGCVPRIRQALEELEIGHLTCIIPTHIHVDHAGGMGTLARLFPEAMVVVHPAGRKHAVDPSRLIRSTKSAFGDGFEEVYGPVEPVPENQLRVPLDGETLRFGRRKLRIIYAPGHSPHHIAILDSASGGLFCGEALGLPVQRGEIVPLPAVAPPSFDQELYLQTIDKLRKLHPRILFYSHGGVGSDPERLTRMAEHHTRMLGDFIREALKAGKDPVVIQRELRDYVRASLGVELESIDLAMTVGAYALYYRGIEPA